MRRVRVVLLIVIGLCSAAPGQELSTEVIQSEEELYLWWRQGVIDSVEYERLREILLSGIDSTTAHWLDYIPNLSWFTPLPAELDTRLEQQQRQVFEQERPQPGRRFPGRFRYRLNHRLDRTDRTRQRFWLNFDSGSDWRVSVQLQRGSDGIERVANRAVHWRQADRGWLREIVVGNYSRRLGLGTVIGYRGKLIDGARGWSGEALLYPDYGGSNGMFVKGRLGDYSVSTLLSRHRDDQLDLTTAASEFARAVGRLRPRLVVAYNNLGRHGTDSSLGDVKLSLGGRYRYSGGYLDAEGAVQLDSRSGPCAVIFEGKHHFSQAQVEYAGWGYSDDFIDLSSGSRAAVMSHRDSLGPVGYAITTRRQGQEGVLVRTILLPAKDWRLSSSVLAASFDRSFVNLQLLATLSCDVRRTFSVQLRYLSRTRRRPDHSGRTTQQHVQLDGQWAARNLDLRSWIAYNTSDDRADYLSLSGDMKMDEQRLGKVHLSGRLAELDAQSLQIIRWYAFAALTQPAFEGIDFAVRLTHQYDRRSASPHLNMITLEVRAGW